MSFSLKKFWYKLSGIWVGRLFKNMKKLSTEFGTFLIASLYASTHYLIRYIFPLLENGICELVTEIWLAGAIFTTFVIIRVIKGNGNHINGDIQ